jgi:hypothetical protein
MTERELLRHTAEIAADYLETLDTRSVAAEHDYREMLAALDRPLPEGPCNPLEVVEELVGAADDGLVAMGSGRHLGFVIGGALPGSMAVDWLVSTWDQNACLAEVSPATSALEAVAGRWVIQLLGLPPTSTFAFVTGCQMAHVTCLAAARHGVYLRGGLERPREGPRGSAAASRRRRREAPRDGHPRSPVARHRPRAGGRPAGRPGGSDGRLAARVRARARCADDHLRTSG